MACSKHQSEAEILDEICDDCVLRDIAFFTPYTPQELGTRLRMEKHEIDNCAQPYDSLYEQRYQVYYYWKQSNGKRATNRALLAALGRCLPPDKLFIDKVNQRILLGRTDLTETTDSTEGTSIVQSDAPRVSVSDPLAAASTSEPVQQPTRSLSDNIVNERMLEISYNMLDISILNNTHLTHEMKRYIESNRQLRRANSVLMTKLTNESRRRSIAEEKLVRIEEERNKFMFENASLHAQIGQLEQSENHQSDASTAHQDQSTDEDTCGTAGHLEHPLASMDANMLVNITGYNSMPSLPHYDYSPSSIPSQLEQETVSERAEFQVLPSSYHPSSNSNSFYNTDPPPLPPPPPPSQQLPNFHAALLPQSIHSAQSHLSFTNALNSSSYFSQTEMTGSTQISCSQQGQEQSSTNSNSRSDFIDGRVSFYISNTSPPAVEPSLDEGTIVEDSLVPETICSSLSAENETQTTPGSSCNDRAPEPVLLFDETTQLEWPNYHN
uniref:Death domain-containing protein n=1 Tax=Amphimedon queenslandica TaxID=400682 RepID=A0A1X7VFN5_AMPQE